MKKRVKTSTIISLCIFFISVVILVYPSINERIAKTRVHEDIKEKLTDEIMSANIRIERVEDYGNRISIIIVEVVSFLKKKMIHIMH